MFGTCHRHHVFRWLVFSVMLAVILMVWIHRPDRTSGVWKQKVQRTNRTESQTPTPVAPQCTTAGAAAPGQMLLVNGTKTLLVSAFQEHRKDGKEVRVLAVVQRDELVAYRCRFCCQDGLLVTEGVRHINYEHFDYPYSAADIVCPLPSGCETPSHISVTSAAAESEDETNGEFLEVNNQEVKHDSFPFEFTVCLSTMFNYTNVLQLVQGLEMLQLLGVSRVVVYQTSNSPEAQHVLDFYTSTGFVEVIPWSLPRFLNVAQGWPPGTSPGDIHYYGQVPALNDCLYRYMYQTRYVAMHDIDELIIPQTVNSWPEMMPLLKKKYGADRCYMFQNFVFPITASRPPPESQSRPPSSPDWQYVPGINILDHLYHEPIIRSTEYGNFKIIVNPRSVTSVTVHGVLKPPNICAWVNRNMARMFHTRSPRQPELTSDKLIYDGRLLTFGDRLTKKVNAALRQCGLIPEAQ